MHVREKNPITVKQAAIMADRFFEDRESYPEHPRWQRKFFQPRQQETAYHPMMNDGDNTTSPTTPIGKKDQFTPSSAQEKPTIERLKGPQCYHCHEWGHIAAKCPKKVMEVNQCDVKVEAEPPYLVSGLIESKEYENLILDCAAQVSVIQPQAVPAECYTGK